MSLIELYALMKSVSQSVSHSVHLAAVSGKAESVSSVQRREVKCRRRVAEKEKERIVVQVPYNGVSRGCV